MKKILAFVLTLAMTAGMLSGCAGVPVAVTEPQDAVKEEVAATVDGEAVKTGLYVNASLSAENATAEADGTAATDISVIAVTVSDSGVIESCAIDAIQGKVSVNAEGQLTWKVGPAATAICWPTSPRRRQRSSAGSSARSRTCSALVPRRRRRTSWPS